MTDRKRLEPGATFASPPCFMHEVDPAYFGFSDVEGSVMSGVASQVSNETLSEIGSALLRELPDAIIYADSVGLIRFWNAGAERLFGFTVEEAMGKSLDIIIPERLRDRHWDGYRAMMETGKSSHEPEEILSVPAITKSGDRRSIQFTNAPVYDRAGKVEGIVAVLRDATDSFDELKRLRKAVREAAAKS